MESFLVKIYHTEKDDREEFLEDLSNEELQKLVDDTEFCMKALQNLQTLYEKMETYKKHRESLLFKIWWLFNRAAKKRWQEKYNKDRLELEKEEKRISKTVVWELLDEEKTALERVHPRLALSDRLFARKFAVVSLRYMMASELIRPIIAEAESRG